MPDPTYTIDGRTITFHRKWPDSDRFFDFTSEPEKVLAYLQGRAAVEIGGTDGFVLHEGEPWFVSESDSHDAFRRDVPAAKPSSTKKQSEAAMPPAQATDSPPAEPSGDVGG